MIIYDSRNYFGVLCSFSGSSLSGVRLLILLAVAWAMWAVKSIETMEQGRSTVSLPSLSGIATVAGVMLAMQAATAFARFQDGLENAVKIENAAHEAIRHAAMFFDNAETDWMKHAVRRSLLGALLSIFVDLRVSAAGGGDIATALGNQVLRDAVEEGFLSNEELETAAKADAAPFASQRVPAHIARCVSVATQRKLGHALLFEPEYASWREQWRVEASQQPTTNIVKIFDGHWKVILDAHQAMHALTTAAFPLHFVQVSRIMWFTAMVALPMDWAADLGLFGTAFAQLIFSVAYFSAERVAVDLENPFGGHIHAVPLDAMLRTFEQASRAALRECDELRGGGEGVRRDGFGQDAAGRAKVLDVMATLRPLRHLDAQIAARAAKVRRKEKVRSRRRKAILAARRSALTGDGEGAPLTGGKGDVESDGGAGGGGGGGGGGVEEVDWDEAFAEEFAVEFLDEVPVPLLPENARVGVASVSWNLNERLPSKDDAAALFDEIFDRHAASEGKQVRAERKPSASPTKTGGGGEGGGEGGGGGGGRGGGQPPLRVVAVAAQEACAVSVTNIGLFAKQVQEWHALCAEALGLRDFMPLASPSLGATALAVFVHKSLFRAASCVELDAVACGFGGVLANKGAAAVALHLHGSRLCFVGAHLAAHQDHVARRHADQRRIGDALFSSNGLHPAYRRLQPLSEIPDYAAAAAAAAGEAPSSDQMAGDGEEEEGGGGDGGGGGGGAGELAVEPFDAPDAARLARMFDFVFFAGDLNYRIDAGRSQVEMMVDAAFKDKDGGSGGRRGSPRSPSPPPEAQWLLARDQLSKALAAGTAFRGFEEAAIEFRPTFKFDPDTDVYDTSEKQRVPAWCDRILFKPSDSLVQTHYESFPGARHSDHRPVYSIFLLDLD